MSAYCDGEGQGPGRAVLVGGLIAAAVLGLSLLAVGASPAELPEPPSSVEVLAGAGVSLSDSSAAWPIARISVESPLFLGRNPFGRLAIDVSFLGLPGDSIDLAKVETYKALDFSAEYKWRIGSSPGGSGATYAVARASFSTRVLPTDPAPRDRYARGYWVGVRAEHREAGGPITRAVEVLYGRSEIASPEAHYGQLMVAGHVTVTTVKGVSLVIGGDAHLNLGKSVARGARDVARVWVAVSRGA